MSDLPLSEGCYARVRLRPDCDGGGKPHHTAEDGARVLVTVIDPGDGHTACSNYKGLPWSTVRPPPGGLGVGRMFRPDELEVLAPNRIDPTEEEQAERFRLRARCDGAVKTSRCTCVRRVLSLLPLTTSHYALIIAMLVVAL
jgi:hypothetical protein